MILTAYFDESGTHGSSPITVMGGVMANTLQWSRFEMEFDRVRRKYGFRVFHTKKFKSRSGDFAGWTRERCLELVWELADITKSAFMGAVVFPLDNATYESDYRLGKKPSKLTLDSRYGLCFRQCLLHFLREVLRRERKGKTSKLNVVLESGHRNGGDAERIFRELKKEMRGEHWDVLGRFEFADKVECSPLMMADFLAHSTYTKELKERAGRPAKPDGSPIRERVVTHLRYKPGGLGALKASLVEGTKSKGR